MTEIPNYRNTEQKLRPAVDVEEALFCANYTYVNGVAMLLPGVPFSDDAVALLLFDEITEQTRAEAARILTRVGGSQMPSNSLAEAFRRAEADQTCEMNRTLDEEE